MFNIRVVLLDAITRLAAFHRGCEQTCKMGDLLMGVAAQQSVGVVSYSK